MCKRSIRFEYGFTRPVLWRAGAHEMERLAWVLFTDAKETGERDVNLDVRIKINSVAASSAQVQLEKAGEGDHSTKRFEPREMLLDKKA